MSHDRSTVASPTSNLQGCSSHETSHLPRVTFSLCGQAIGPNAAKLSSAIGKVAKSNISPCIDNWSQVPILVKEHMWEIVSSMFEVPIENKAYVLKKANAHWRNWKSKLRRDFYDKYQTDVERKNNPPKKVKKEDWEKFVNMCSMEVSIAKRNHGKEARKALKSPHTSGRMGQARVAENLRQQNPGAEITRTQTWLATHTPKNSSARCEYVERVAGLYEDNPSIAKKDLDHDAVALILGRDNRGRVKGMGDGVSKTSIKYSDPYKKALQKEQELQVILQTEVDNLGKRLEVESRDLRREMEAMFATLSQANTQMRPSMERGSSSQERVAGLYEDNPSIAKKDLDHDAVALILGRDNRGRVKGMGDGVSKTSIKYSDPYKKALQKEQELQVILQTEVDNLGKRLEVESRDLRREMEAMFATLSQANTQMRPSMERGSSSQGSQSFQSQAANLEQTITPTRGPSSCKLQHMIKKHIIAYGRL